MLAIVKRSRASALKRIAPVQQATYLAFHFLRGHFFTYTYRRYALGESSRARMYTHTRTHYTTHIPRFDTRLSEFAFSRHTALARFSWLDNGLTNRR